MRRRALLPLATASTAVVGITALFEALLRRHLYRISEWSSASPADTGLPYEEMTFSTADGISLPGWYFSAQSPLVTILFMRGTRYNARVLWSGQERARAFGDFLRAVGCSFFVFDYRGYAPGSGTPSEQATYLDAEAALAYLHTRPDVDTSRMILYGFSLGTGVAVELALREPCRGLILRAPFTSLREVAQERLPALRMLFRLMPWLPLTHYDSAAKIPNLRVPVLMMHGEADESVPLWMGRRLYELAPEPRTFLALPGVAHSDFPAELIAPAVRRFVESVTATGAPSLETR